jgi:single-stranded-DNA-specific exonuclease
MKKKQEWIDYISKLSHKDTVVFDITNHYKQGFINLVYDVIVLDPRSNTEDKSFILVDDNILLESKDDIIEFMSNLFIQNVKYIKPTTVDVKRELLELIHNANMIIRVENEFGQLILDDINTIYEIAKSFGINPLHAIILDNRISIHEWWNIPDIVNPTITSYKRLLTDDNNVYKATDIIEKFRKKKNANIIAVVDSDADGVISGAIIKRYFKEYLKKDITVFSNDRKYGNGINQYIVNKLIEEEDNIDLLITADHGSSDDPRYKQLKEHFPNINILVTDHHLLPNEGRPINVNCFVNPMDSESKLPQYITGATVIYIVLATHYGRYIKSGKMLLPDLLAFAGITVISDQVRLDKPLNRFIVHHLFNMYDKLKDDIPFFNSLANKIGVEQLTQYDLNRNIIPVINSGGRLNESNKSLDWISSTEEDSLDACAYMVQLNTKRRNMQKRLKNDIVLHTTEDVVIGTIEDESGEGIVGILSNMIGEDYSLPCFMFVYDEKANVYRGSGRAICDNVSIKEIIDRGKKNGCIIRGGGHRGAGGCVLKGDTGLDDFIQICKEYMSDIKCQINTATDIVLPIKSIGEAIFNVVQELQPYGMGFKPFTLEVSGVSVGGFDSENFSKFTLMEDGYVIDIIYFGYFPTQKGVKYKVVGTLERDNKDKSKFNIVANAIEEIQ